MKRIELVIEWGKVEEFRLGFAYTKDEILAHEYISPRGVGEILKEMKYTLLKDYFKYVEPCFNRTKAVCLYKLEKCEKMIVKGKHLAKVSFVAISLGASIGGILLPNGLINVYEKTSTVTIDSTLSVPPLVGASTKAKLPKKGKAVVRTKAMTLIEIRNKLALYETKLKFNPNVKKLYVGKYKEELTEPSKNPILQKFDSYEDGVLYFYYLAKYHNLTQPNKVNVRAYMAQVGIEMGLRPIKRGGVSVLGTYANNPHGGKTFEKGATNFIWSKDDEYRKGKKVHSKFKVFSSFGEALQDYAELIQADRYRGKCDVEYIREVVEKGKYVTKITVLKNDISPYLASAHWYKFIHGLRLSGYCTVPENQYERQCSITYAEQSKVLKKHGITE